jgi:alcohol dehydrogenase class IV
VRFEFASAARVVFGAGAARQSGKEIRAFGSRFLLVTGQQPDRAAWLAEALRDAGAAAVSFCVEDEPTVALVRAAVALARAESVDAVIGCGGGSALDCAKAAAALAPHPGDPLDYLEVVGRGLSLPGPGLPFVALPTTAGTGSEVTRNAVLGATEQGVKASLRSPHMLARLAIVDPELTLGLPPEVTAATGLDALTQVIEPFVSARANPLTDGLCREGIRRAADCLERAFLDGSDLEARTGMSLASLCGGFALANAGLGAAHGFAAPIGGRFPAPHGAVCAALLPPVMDANLRALRERAPQHPSIARYDEVARLVTGWPEAAAEDGIDWVRRLAARLRIPPLRCYGLAEADVEPLCAAAAQASSMKANPVALTPEELTGILRAAL